jgi:hypothetical protein
MTRELIRALREADEVLRDVELSPGARRRIDERLESRPSPARPWRFAILAFAAVATAALLMVRWPHEAPKKPSLPAELGGLVLLAQSTNLRATMEGDVVAITQGEVKLQDAKWGIALQVARPTRLRREASGIHVLKGEVEVEVARRPVAGGPARVLVSQGVIEVHGTRFTVLEEGARGLVTLHEGAILFRGLDDRAVELHPGMTLGWPLADEPPPPSAPPPTPHLRKVTHVSKRGIHARATEPSLGNAMAADTPPADVRETLSQIASMRARGAYAEAVDQLQGALHGSLRPASRELLSYELGSILTYHLRDQRQACAQWKTHLAAFPRGARANDARSAQHSLGCE